MMRFLIAALSFLAVASSVLAFPEPNFVTGDTRGMVRVSSITNVRRASFDVASAVHDPTLCKDSSGRYFVFCMSDQYSDMSSGELH